MDTLEIALPCSRPHPFGVRADHGLGRTELSMPPRIEDTDLWFV